MPPLPVYVDGPLATDATHLYCSYRQDLNLETSPGGESEGQLPLYCAHVHFVQDISQSRALNTRSGPMIIISASGMCTGGRVLHHLKWRLPHPENAVLFVGYQAGGTRGRRLLSGAPAVAIHGETVPVRARIEVATALSTHADQADLVRWLGAFRKPHKRLFLVHSETDARTTLSALIRNTLGWQTLLPEYGDQVECD